MGKNKNGSFRKGEGEPFFKRFPSIINIKS